MKPLIPVFLSLLAPVLHAQTSVQDRGLQRVLSRFEALEAEDQERILERIQATIVESEHPLSRLEKQMRSEARIAALEVETADAKRAYDADQYAPALGLKTRVIAKGSSKWKREFKRVTTLPPRESGAGWVYDYGRDVLVQPDQSLPPRERLIHYYHGRLPAPDRFRARIEAGLDFEADFDARADYFEHHYRDRGGNVFEGIRLWDVWNSGRELEVSDVEAIAWLRLVGKDSRYKSPIPASAHRGIYRRIAASFEEWREYRLLHEALASRLATPEEPLSPWFAPLAPHLDRAWAIVDYDLVRMREWLEAVADRKAFVREIDARSERLESADPSLAQRLAARAGWETILRTATEQILREEGLMGLGRRF